MKCNVFKLRLFWKFFAYYFVAQITTLLLVGLLLHSHQASNTINNLEVLNHSAQSKSAQDKTVSSIQTQIVDQENTTIPVIPLIVGLIVSLFFSAYLACNVIRPIYLLMSSFDQVAKGNLKATVSDQMRGRNDEIAELGIHFDRMVRQINQLIQSQIRLLHHVSHELRSPLARIQIAVGLAKQGPTDLDKTIARVELEVTRMDKLIGEALDLSRLDSGVEKLTKQPFSLSELLDEIVVDARFEAKVKNITILQDCPDHVEISANQEKLHRAIENVIRNAIKYSVEGDTVVISCEISTDQTVSIKVKDQGEGVLETELNDLFEPFFKGQLGEKTKGYGLGLAIAKQIVDAHGGEMIATNIHLVSEKPTGLCVEIKLPV
jgi:two-component system OmpR family sensor kinase